MCFSPLGLYSFCLWRVDSHMCEPTVKGNESMQFLFAWTTCESVALSRLSFTSRTSVSNLQMTCQASMSVTVTEDLASTRGGMIWGLRPIQSWKGVKPVDLFIVFIRLKCILGRAQTQPNWFRLTCYLNAWLTVLYVHSLAPSVSGWQAVDSLISHPSTYRALSRIWTQRVYHGLILFQRVACSCNSICWRKVKLDLQWRCWFLMAPIECHFLGDQCLLWLSFCHHLLEVVQ